MPELELPKTEVPLGHSANLLEPSVVTKPVPPHLIGQMSAELWNRAWGYIGLQAVGQDLKDHGLIIKRRVSVLILLCVVFFLGFLVKGHLDKSANLSSDDNARRSDDLAKSYKSQLDAANTTIISLKVDAGEKQREKDAEVQKVTGERDSALQQKTQLESMPQTAIAAYESTAVLASNAYILSKPLGAPSFKLKVNGLELSNYVSGQFYKIPLNSSREIVLQVDPLDSDEMPVANSTIDTTFLVNATNLNMNTGPNLWDQLAIGDTNCSYRFVESKTITSINGFDAAKFSISPNCVFTNVAAKIEIFVPGIKGITTSIVNFQVP